MDDCSEIQQLILRERYSRDFGLWEQMLCCFREDAHIDISWIQGSAKDFVEGSKDMAARGMKATHRLDPILVNINGNRALATLGGIIDIPTVIDEKEFTLSAYSQFYYKVDKRAGSWGLMSFQAIYRRDELVPARSGDCARMPDELYARFRPSYRNLCWSLHMKGYEPNLTMPGSDKPETVASLLEELESWFAG